MGVMTEVVGRHQIRQRRRLRSGRRRTLYVSEHLARRILALTLDARQRVTATRVFADFAQHDATKTFPIRRPDPTAIALRPGLLAVAEYGEGRVHLFDRDGKHLNTLKVSMPFVDTVAFDSCRQSLCRRRVPEHAAALRGRGGAVRAGGVAGAQLKFQTELRGCRAASAATMLSTDSAAKQCSEAV